MKKFEEGSSQWSNDAKLGHDETNAPGGQDKERKEENKKHHPDKPQKPDKNTYPPVK